MPNIDILTNYKHILLDEWITRLLLDNILINCIIMNIKITITWDNIQDKIDNLLILDNICIITE